MLIKNVTYNEYPPAFEVRRSGAKAVVVFPTDIEEIQIEEQVEPSENVSSLLPEIGSGTSTTTQYLAHKVYQLETNWTPNIEQRIEANFAGWLAKAKIPAVQEATLSDVVEAVNALTELVLGGE